MTGYFYGKSVKRVQQLVRNCWNTWWYSDEAWFVVRPFGTTRKLTLS